METEKKEVGGDITSLDVAPIPVGRQRSRYLAVGTADSTVRHPLPIFPAMPIKSNFTDRSIDLRQGWRV